MYLYVKKRGISMSVFLKNITVKGIKNIDQAVEVVFFKKDAETLSELREYNVKAIYGPNGSGKTALVHAFDLLVDLFSDSGYLYHESTLKLLTELMNKVCNRIEIAVEFFYSDNNKSNMDKYIIHIENSLNGFVVAYEKYSSREINSTKESIIFESKNGELTACLFNKNVQNDLLNLIYKRTIGDVLLDNIIRFTSQEGTTKEKSEEYSKAFVMMYPFYDLFTKMNIILDSKDNHMPAISRTIPSLVNSGIKDNHSIDLTPVTVPFGYSNKEMTESQLKAFRSRTKKVEKFIRLFKPEIVSIDIDQRMISQSKDETTYLVNQSINYGKYKIDLEFESVGIKKLMDLYNGIDRVIHGQILIVDELDSHINDIYLVDIVQYISDYAKGQLIFTTHNISPMDVLKTKKLSIDFMSSSAILTSWKQVGNYSPQRLYQKGMISGLPFNLDTEDFLEVFSHED